MPTSTASSTTRRSAPTPFGSRPPRPGCARSRSRSAADVLGDYVALFGAGVASFLAPCLVPLLPAYLGIIVGESADAHDTAKAVPATLVFILGFATVFAGFGVAAGFVGRSLSPLQDAVQRVGGVVIILFGLALLGLLRGPLVRERRLI